MTVAEWFKGLGARRTADDPTGRKHQMGFIGFVVAMLLLISALIVIQADRSEAAVICRGPISGRSSGIFPPGVALTASRWCSNSTGISFETVPSFSRSYSESPAYNFEKWFPSVSASGRGTAPNGTPNVSYRVMWIAAEFELRVPPHNHTYPHGVRIWAWANGNYSIRGTSTVPSSPIPKP